MFCGTGDSPRDDSGFESGLREINSGHDCVSVLWWGKKSGEMERKEENQELMVPQTSRSGSRMTPLTTLKQTQNPKALSPSRVGWCVEARLTSFYSESAQAAALSRMASFPGSSTVAIWDAFPCRVGSIWVATSKTITSNIKEITFGDHKQVSAFHSFGISRL